MMMMMMISLQNINQSAFIMDTRCFLWSRNCKFKCIHTIFNQGYDPRLLESNAKKRIFTISQVLPQAFGSRPLIDAVRIRNSASPCWICVGKSGIGTGFPPSISVFPSQYQIDTHLNTTLDRTSGRSLGPLQTKQCSFGYVGSTGQRKKYVHGLFWLQSVTMRGTVPPIFHKPRDVTC